VGSVPNPLLSQDAEESLDIISKLPENAMNSSDEGDFEFPAVGSMAWLCDHRMKALPDPTHQTPTNNIEDLTCHYP